jgi:hypothetical protein
MERFSIDVAERVVPAPAASGANDPVSPARDEMYAPAVTATNTSFVVSKEQ